MQIERERGYLIVAINNSTTDYVACARALAKNIHAVEPGAAVCLLTDDDSVSDPAFDFVRSFPFGDKSQGEWKLENDWQCFYASPFRQTIKIEADMLLPRSIHHWFDICQRQDVVLTIGARDCHNQRSPSRAYRKIFDDNDLPDIYNAITYWRLSPLAKTFFDTVREITENWQSAMSALKYGADQPFNTDLAYAIAANLIGVDHVTLPGDVPGLIHMKPAIIGTASDDWTENMIWEFSQNSFRINTVEQEWPVHYHVKSFAKEVEKYHG